MGRIYTRPGSQYLWVKYYVAGKPRYESTHTTKETEARRILRDREGRVATGQPILPRADRVRYDEIAADLRRHYETSGERDLKEAEKRLKPLAAFFSGRRVASLSGADAETYAQRRRAGGAANGTINRDLAVLTKMLRLAYENGKLLRLPVIHKLKEAAPREGFFEREQFEAVRRHLPPHLQVAAAVAYTYGWRMQSEVLALERRHLDLDAGTLRLDPGTTKNRDGRVVRLTPELRTLLGEQLERVRALERTLGRVIPFLFPHPTNGRRYRAGDRIRDFRKAWLTACDRAGVPGRLRHDLRRTAVRNMVNLGVPERVAMAITGHRTRSVFDRYHIVSPADLDAAAEKLAGSIAPSPIPVASSTVVPIRTHRTR